MLLRMVPALKSSKFEARLPRPSSNTEMVIRIFETSVYSLLKFVRC